MPCLEALDAPAQLGALHRPFNRLACEKLRRRWNSLRKGKQIDGDLLDRTAAKNIVPFPRRKIAARHQHPVVEVRQHLERGEFTPARRSIRLEAPDARNELRA